MLAHSPFGRTGHESSRVIFGAAALSRVSQQTADTLLPILLEHGVNHLDTAAGYGESELRLRPWLSANPDAFFIASKTGERGGDAARASLEQSLTRLGVDQLDLIQLHNLVEEEEFDQAYSKGGALEALVRARDEGLVRFIGVTGHGLRIPHMHLRSLERFPFDAVLFPYNYALMRSDAYRHDVEELLERCAERGVATQTIKSVARRRWAQRAPDAPHRSWYEPLDDAAAIGRAVGFVLGHSQLFLNTSSDYELLQTVLDKAESNPSVPSDTELDADMASFDITPLFDGGELERI